MTGVMSMSSAKDMKVGSRGQSGLSSTRLGLLRSWPQQCMQPWPSRVLLFACCLMFQFSESLSEAEFALFVFVSVLPAGFLPEFCHGL